MRKAHLFVLTVLFIVSGCMEVEEKISVNSDSTGYYEAHYIFSDELTSMLQASMEGASGSANFPTSQEDLERHFLGEGVRIMNSSFDVKDGRLVSQFRVEFDDAVAFFNVPGMRNRFQFFSEGDRLHLKSIPQNGAGSMQPSFSVGSESSSELSMEAENAEELRAMQTAMQESMKEFLKGLKISITVELPSEILDSNAPIVEGRKAVWIIDEQRIYESLRGEALDDQLWVSCSTDGLSFIPDGHKEMPRMVSVPPDQTSPTRSVSRAPDESELSVATPPAEAKSISSGHLSPNEIDSGGRSIIFLQNGRRMEVDGYDKNGDMLNLRRFGGTISLPISSIKAVQNKAVQ